MRISYIEIKNFKSYREKQRIEFATDKTRPITIIEGQMGHGKSNLLNAFYWCLFDSYWDGDKNKLVESPNPNEVYLFNKGATKDLSREGENIEMLVETCFFDDEGNKYVADRLQTGFYQKGAWTFKRNSHLKLVRISSKDGTSRTYEGDTAIRQVEKIIPPSLSNYFLFRGENRTELVKLQGKSKFQEALNELSKISLFIRSVDHLEKVKDEFRKDLADQAEEDLKKLMNKSLDDKKDAKKVLEELQKALEDLELIEQEKQDEYNKYRDRIKKDRDALELKGKIEKEESEKSQLGKDLDTLYEDQRKNVTRNWGSLLVEDLIKKIKKRHQDAVNSGVYPPDIQASVIEKILHDLKCICGREIEEQSREFELIERLKEINTYDHLVTQIERVTGNLDAVANLVKEFPEEIRQNAKASEDLRSEINLKQELIQSYSKKIGDISESLDELQKKQDKAKEEEKRTHIKIEETKKLIANKQTDIDTIEKQLQEYEKKIKKSKIPGIKLDLAEKALVEAKNLKNEYEKAIYKDLEKYTQEHWDLLVYDRLNYRRISLDPKNMYFEIYDDEGRPSRSIMNTGHSILLVLSFISALTRIAREIWHEEFPLVMDAPTSEIGDSAMQTALSGFTKVFSQAIVILKDGSVAHTLPPYLKDKVGKRYWIEFHKEQQHSKVEPKELVYA